MLHACHTYLSRGSHSSALNSDAVHLGVEVRSVERRQREAQGLELVVDILASR